MNTKAFLIIQTWLDGKVQSVSQISCISEKGELQNSTNIQNDIKIKPEKPVIRQKEKGFLSNTPSIENTGSSFSDIIL